jgi:ABC-2 type transport system ATP-binding protein
MRALLDLDEFLATPVRQLSLGQRVRGDLAAALLHDPAILYLDEPTIGLDVVAKARVREFLLTINAERGVTVLLTTHDMDDIEMLCPRMLIVDHGRKLYDGAVAGIRERFGGERTVVADLDGAPVGVSALGELPVGVRRMRVEGPRVWLALGAGAPPAHELIAWLGARERLRDVSIQEPAIEAVVRRIYEEGLLAPAVETVAG